MSPPPKRDFPDVGLNAERGRSKLHFTGQLRDFNALVGDLYSMIEDIDPMMEQVPEIEDGEQRSWGDSVSDLSPPADDSGPAGGQS